MFFWVLTYLYTSPFIMVHVLGYFDFEFTMSMITFDVIDDDILSGKSAASPSASMGYMSPRISSPMHPSGGGRGGGGGGGGGRGGGRGGGGFGRGGGRMGRDRDLIGKTIKVTQGPYKGHIGIVKVNH